MLAEENTLPHPIVYAKSSPYQRIVLTKGQGGFQLYLNGNLQFNSTDEYRYHEALVHPVLVGGEIARAGCWCWAGATAWRFAKF